MIGKLTGRVDSQGEGWVILDVGGVGYEVWCSPRTLANLPSPGEVVSLAIETHVREQEIRLFGFASPAERQWFRLLQTVQGVGAKVALAILGVLTPTELANAIALGDKAMVARAPGVGPKVAGRIIAELKDKIPDTLAPDLAAISDAQAPSPTPDEAVDAISALTNLGYAQAQASQAVAAVLRKAEGKWETADIIRHALKELAR